MVTCPLLGLTALQLSDDICKGKRQKQLVVNQNHKNLWLFNSLINIILITQTATRVREMLFNLPHQLCQSNNLKPLGFLKTLRISVYDCLIFAFNVLLITLITEQLWVW